VKSFWVRIKGENFGYKLDGCMLLDGVQGIMAYISFFRRSTCIR